MAIRNRELSQFGSFIYIDDSTRSVGIATTSTPYVGIGTATPTVKFEVSGDTNLKGTTNIVGNMSVSGSTNITGVVSATSYYLNGAPLVNASVQNWFSSGGDVYQLGSVGIGTSVFAEKLTVVGNISATGNVSVSGNISGGRFISTVSNGTSPFQVTSQTLVANLNSDYLRGGIPGSNINSYDIVTIGAQQTLSNKTLVFPVFTGLGVTFSGSTSGSVRLSASPVAGTPTLLLPTTSGTLVSTGDVGVVTKTMMSSLNIVNSDVDSGAAIAYSKLNLAGSITNNDIASGASIATTKLAASTISGIALGSNLNSLTAGSFVSYSSGTTYNGSSAITVSVAATTANTSNTIVARNSSGDFTAGTISATNLTASQTIQAANTNITQVTATNGNFTGIVTATQIQTSNINITQITAVNGNFTGIITAVNGNFTGIVTATDFNSTSDITLKENVHTVENSLETVESIRGVSFNWKETGKKSYGVIAQELEEILPELVTDGEIKTVNYNGIIGVLIEAVKELKAEIEDLKNSK